MQSYDNRAGRIRLAVSAQGYLDHDYGHGAMIECPDGWNDSCPIVRLTISLEELHDLKHMIERALARTSS